MIKTITKIREMLTKGERKEIVLLVIGLIVLSLSEVLSIGVIIPIISLFVKPDIIQSSKWLRWVYDLTGAASEQSFLMILVAAAFILFLAKFLYSVIMIYRQQSIMGNIYNRLTGEALNSYLEKPYMFHLTNNSSVL